MDSWSAAGRVQSIDAERLAYLDESPWTAMARSFVVYLCIITGVYLALDDPFKNPTPGQYAKLTGTVSALGFSGWLRSQTRAGLADPWSSLPGSERYKGWSGAARD